MVEHRWYRDRTVMLIIGLAVGLAAGIVTWRVMSRMDMDWALGRNQPLIAGIAIGFAFAALLALATPRLK